MEDFPAYAPKTNPDESLWCWTKYGQLVSFQLGNLAPTDVDGIARAYMERLDCLETPTSTAAFVCSSCQTAVNITMMTLLLSDSIFQVSGRQFEFLLTRPLLPDKVYAL